MPKKIVLTEEQLNKVITEAFVEKTEVKNIVKDYVKNDRDFEKKVKEISADVVKNLFRLLWQRNNFWDSEIRR